MIRPLTAKEGVVDRLRLVAFAELQARDLFYWGAETFKATAPAQWLEIWVRFAEVENRHAQMLLDRMAELGGDIAGRAVSDKLSRLCFASTDPVLFLFLLASAEERGMESGNILAGQMHTVDAVSANIFKQIADEEVEHVEMGKIALAPYVQEELRQRAVALSATL